MKNKPRITARQLSKIVGINTRNVQVHIKTLKMMGCVKRIGSDRAGYWEVLEGLVSKWE